MTSKRLYFLLLGIIGVLFVGLIVGTYGINTLLASQADKLTDLKAKSMALSQEQLSLARAKEEIKKYSGLEQIAKSVVPEDKDQAEAVREIVNFASQSNVTLSSITFPASTLGSSAVSNGATSSLSSAAAAKALDSVNSASNSLSQLQAVPNIPGVYLLQITIQSDANKPVPYNSFINFLTALERNRRTAQVSTISIQPNAINPSLLTFTLSLDEYIKP